MTYPVVDTVFTQGTTITSDWLNGVNDYVNDQTASQISYTPPFTGGVQTTVQNKLSETVSVKDFGAVGDGVTDDTAAFVAAAASTAALHLGNGTYLISPASLITLQCAELIGENATIKLGANINFSMLKLVNASRVSGITFDGDNHYAGDNNYDHFLLSVWSSKCTIENCSFVNVSGITDHWQYGLGILWNCQSVTSNCHFEEIHTQTNPTNTAGFCGGIFIASDPANTTNLVQTAHTVQNCTFAQIYTTANGAGQLYHDSDGIRNFIYDYESLSSTLQDVVRNSTITVQGCSFVDVRKSGTKLSNCIVSVENVRFRILDAGTQTQVYSAFRYQSGPFFSLRNASVSGQLIAQGCLPGGVKNIIDNLYFTTTNTDGTAVFVASSDTVEQCEISNVYVNSASYLVKANPATEITVRDSKMVVAHTGFLQLIENCGTITFDNCYLQGKTEIYTSAKTLTNLNIRNSTMVNAVTGTVFGNFYITNLELDNVKFTSTNGAVVYGGNVTNVKIKDSEFTTSGSVSTRVFDFTGSAASVYWYNSKLTDTSNKDHGIFTTSPIFRMDGGQINVTCTNAQILLYQSGTANTIRNLVFSGGQAHMLEVQKCDKMVVSDIHSEIASGDIEFWSNTAMKAAVNGLTGQLAGTPIITTNYTVTSSGVAPL